MKPADALHIQSYSDEDLMELFQGGYENAFNLIVERYRDRIHNFIYRYTKNHLDCEDLVQETFLRVFKCRNSYERIAKFSTWLYTIANNLVRTHYKKSARMKLSSVNGLDSEDNEFEMDIPDKSENILEEIDNTMMIQFVEKALEIMPVEFKEVLIMRDIECLTYEEIMEISGLPMGTVKSRINRGRVRLQQLIKNHIKCETLFV